VESLEAAKVLRKLNGEKNSSYIFAGGHGKNKKRVKRQKRRDLGRLLVLKTGQWEKPKPDPAVSI